MDVEKLLELIEDYNPDEVEKVKKAYLYAAYLHDGQYRESGEAYIIHPLNVAYILAEMHADSDTVCAGLLHDVLEDTKASKEDIQKELGGMDMIKYDIEIRKAFDKLEELNKD